METTIQALYVTAAGMVLLFLALGFLMLFMHITSRLLPFRVEPETEASAEETSPSESATGPGDQGDLGAVIAAAAVALALSERDSGLAPVAPTGDNRAGNAESWVLLGRQAQMLARQPR